MSNEKSDKQTEMYKTQVFDACKCVRSAYYNSLIPHSYQILMVL